MRHDLEVLCQDYLNQRDLALSSKKLYQIAFNHYINYLKENHIQYVKTSDVISYKAYRQSLGDSSVWIYIQISALKGLYTYLANHQKRLGLDKAYAYNISIPIQNKQDKYQIKKHLLSPAQAKHLILMTKNRKYIWDYRDHAIMYLMLVSGMKRYEIIEAKRKDYKIVGGVALIYLSSKQGKNGRSFVKLSRGGMSALNDYLVLRDDDNPYLFRSHKYAKKSGQLSVTFFDQMFKRILKKTGLDHEGITPNCLRQTAGILNLMRGGTLSQTYTLLRHARIQSTLVYEDHLKRMKDDSEAALEAFILSEEALKSYQSLIIFLDDEDR